MKKWMIKFWYLLPILLAVFILALYAEWALGLELSPKKVPVFVAYILDIIVLLILIASVVSWVILLINKSWWKAIISFVATVIIVVFLGFFVTMAALFAPDTSDFGKRHPIPDGLAYELPLPIDSHPTEPVDSLDANAGLSVRVGGQGGIYQYDFYYGPLPAGEIYLKCYEVTENIPLSETRLTKESRVKFDTTTSFTKLVDKQKFFIYEGDWGDYYAARIEVWYKNAATNEEKKLAEKVYRVEGWMR